ncbi:E3 ubiquitin-protein ligase lrsam1 [Desmophyllum pertusum]|uniref:E3 ubiquitin-protein ligase lrsam1 n=1 Tax=Desmophyllum pertusum TaxID=174260 RepID=A0A9W9YCX8_9CNID|nr:E3 ubiquitin-protein ligase lrsam1 [Desmophyllum pertusum]
MFSKTDQLSEGLNEGDSPESHEFGDDHEVDSSRSLQSSSDSDSEEEEDDEDDSKSEEPTAKRKRCDEPAEKAEDDGEKKKKKKKRRAADWSGRQMALRRIAKERKARKTDEAKDKDEDEKQLPTALNFVTSVGESREVLLDFLAEDDLLTEEHASAMRVYMNRKYGLSTTDGFNSKATNIYKVALLPQELYDRCIRICHLYEDGELFPPLSSKQRKRRKISSSSFNFLKGLDPLKAGDQDTIAQLLASWEKTKIRPSPQGLIPKGPPTKDKANQIKELADVKKERAQMEAIQALQLQTDAKHCRITSQISMLQDELARLTFTELDKRVERQDAERTVLESKREALTGLLVQLVGEQQKREDELMKRLVEMEHRREADIEDYWLIQYQRLLESKPLTLLEKECDSVISDILAEAGAQDYASHFARHRITWEMLKTMTDKEIKELGIHELGVRKAILSVVQERLRFDTKAKEKENEIEKPEVPVPQAPAPTQPTPSAPVVEHRDMTTECVICMDHRSDVVLLNCGHVCCCFNCSSSLSSCPICRHPVVQRVRIFLS